MGGVHEIRKGLQQVLSSCTACQARDACEQQRALQPQGRLVHRKGHVPTAATECEEPGVGTSMGSRRPVAVVACVEGSFCQYAACLRDELSLTARCEVRPTGEKLTAP